MLRLNTAVKIAVGATLAGVLGYLSLRSSSFMEQVPWMPHWLGVWADHHGVGRNTAAFFGGGLILFVVVGRRVRHLVAASGFATAIEVAQIWIPGRIFDWRDIAASLAGIGLAWVAVWATCRPMTARRC